VTAILLWLALAAPAASDTECLSRITREAVIIREVVRFTPGSAAVGGEPAVLLGRIAEVLARDETIDHTVINGHASPEEDGDPYLLSVDRARVVWEALVAAGVPAQRISYRGLGATPSRHDSGAHVSFDVIVVFDPERPAQPTSVDDAAVARDLKARSVSGDEDAP